MKLTCTTITMESLESGSKIFSLIILCCRLYCAIILLISDTLSIASEDLPKPLRDEEFLGIGVKNLCRTAGTILSKAAVESFTSVDVDGVFKLGKAN